MKPADLDASKAGCAISRLIAFCPPSRGRQWRNFRDGTRSGNSVGTAVWGKIFGTISTRQKFLAMRLELAKHEWARLSANDSLECRNCHSAIAMDLTKQTRRAAEIHTRFLLSKERTCIDCHKGIAHELPDMTGIEPGWRVPPDLTDRQSSRDRDEEALKHYLASTGL